MHNNDLIVHNLFMYTYSNSIDWNLVYDNYKEIKYSSKLKIKKNSYLSFIIIVKKNGSIISYNNLILIINYVTKKSITNIIRLKSVNYPKIIDIFDIL